MKRAIILFLLIVTVVFAFFQMTVFAQQSATDSTTNGKAIADKAQATGVADTTKKDVGKRGFSAQTLWDLVKVAGEFSYLLALVFIFGVVFLFQQFLVLKREMKDAKKIPIEQIPKLGYDEIEKMFTQVTDDEALSIDEEKEEMENLPLLKRMFRRKKASAYQLAHRLFLIFKHQRSTASFNEVTDSFIQYLKDMFKPFETRLAFLSDTAGALGLLGTVWGMFMVFYQGNPSQEDILRGMGIALSTTIIGLVISIFLNSLTTIVMNRFDKHLATINRVNEVFQERFMREELATGAVPTQVIIDSNALANAQTAAHSVPSSGKAGEVSEQSKPPTKRRAKIKHPAEIKVINGNNQAVEVGSELPQPVVVEVVDEDGKPMEGIEVTFRTENGGGNFPNDSNIRKILTDEEGRAETGFTVGKKKGDKIITVSLDGSDLQPKSLLITAKAAPPAKLVEIDGNYQKGELGKRLDKPFVIAIRDKFDNPIPRYEVNFSLTRGTGKFQDSQNAHLTAYTNESGLAEVYFIMGNDRGARDIEVEAKKVTPSKINYEVFAS